MPTAAPPSGGPSTVEVHVVDSNRALATMRFSGRTRDFTWAPLAVLNAIFAAATTADTASNCQKLSAPSAYATGIVISAANRARSIAIITGRLRRYSINPTDGTATTATTATPTADSAATSAGPARRTRIAISANAPNPSPHPYELTA